MNNFISDFKNILKQNIAEHEVDLVLIDFLKKYEGYNFCDLCDLYINCKWADIDGKNVNDLINNFLK